MLLKSLHRPSSLQKSGISGCCSAVQLDCWIPSSKAASRTENQRRKAFLLGLPHIRATWLANQCRNHLHILHLWDVRGTSISNPTVSFHKEDNESQTRGNDILQVTWYENGRGTAPWAPNSTSGTLPLHHDMYLTASPWWVLIPKMWSIYGKVKMPQEGGWQIWSVLAKTSQHRTGAYFTCMSHITATLANEWGSTHPLGTIQWRGHRQVPSIRSHAWQCVMITSMHGPVAPGVGICPGLRLKSPESSSQLCYLHALRPQAIHFSFRVLRVSIWRRQNNAHCPPPAPHKVSTS